VSGKDSPESIANMKNDKRGFPRFQAELAKCDLLCDRSRRKLGLKLWVERESNPPRSALQADALPLSYPPVARSNRAFYRAKLDLSEIQRALILDRSWVMARLSDRHQDFQFPCLKEHSLSDVIDLR
jgi:hypothetical protein